MNLFASAPEAARLFVPGKRSLLASIQSKLATTVALALLLGGNFSPARANTLFDLIELANTNEAARSSDAQWSLGVARAGLANIQQELYPRISFGLEYEIPFDDSAPSLGVGVAADYLLFDWGARAKRQDALHSSEARALLDVAREQHALDFEIARLYLAITHLGLAANGLAAAVSEAQRITPRLFRENIELLTLEELALRETALQLQGQWRSLTFELTQNRERLEQLTGADLAPFPLAPPTFEEMPEPSAIHDVIAAALDNHPEVLSLDLGLRAAAQNAAADRLDARPQIYLSGEARFRTPDVVEYRLGLGVRLGAEPFGAVRIDAQSELQPTGGSGSLALTFPSIVGIDPASPDLDASMQTAQEFRRTLERNLENLYRSHTERVADLAVIETRKRRLVLLREQVSNPPPLLATRLLLEQATLDFQYRLTVLGIEQSKLDFFATAGYLLPQVILESEGGF